MRLTIDVRVPVELHTSRLCLRLFDEDDFDDYAEMVADPRVMQFIGVGHTLSREQAWLNLAQVMGHWQLRGYGLYAAVNLQTGDFVGRVGLFYPHGWPGLEIGWCLRRDYWGGGLAFEAAVKVKQIAKEFLPDTNLISLINQDNRRSLRLAERLGGKAEGVEKTKNQIAMRFCYA